MDDRVSSFVTLVAGLWQKNTWYLAIILVILCVPMALGITALGTVIIFTEITLKIIIATAPIFIFCLMWGFLKDSFAQYSSALLANALTLIVLTTIQKGIMERLIERTSYEGASPIMSATIFMIMGIFMGALIKYVVSTVQSLVKVSIEKVNTEFSSWAKEKGRASREASSQKAKTSAYK